MREYRLLVGAYDWSPQYYGSGVSYAVRPVSIDWADAMLEQLEFYRELSDDRAETAHLFKVLFKEGGFFVEPAEQGVVFVAGHTPPDEDAPDKGAALLNMVSWIGQPEKPKGYKWELVPGSIGDMVDPLGTELEKRALRPSSGDIRWEAVVRHTNDAQVYTDELRVSDLKSIRRRLRLFQGERQDRKERWRELASAHPSDAREILERERLLRSFLPAESSRLPGLSPEWLTPLLGHEDEEVREEMQRHVAWIEDPDKLSD